MACRPQFPFPANASALGFDGTNLWTSHAARRFVTEPTGKRQRSIASRSIGTDLLRAALNATSEEVTRKLKPRTCVHRLRTPLHQRRRCYPCVSSARLSSPLF
jgi:hypothetical protein